MRRIRGKVCSLWFITNPLNCVSINTLGRVGSIKLTCHNMATHSSPMSATTSQVQIAFLLALKVAGLSVSFVTFHTDNFNLSLTWVVPTMEASLPTVIGKFNNLNKIRYLLHFKRRQVFSL